MHGPPNFDLPLPATDVPRSHHQSFFSFRLTGQLQLLINLMACSIIIKMLYGGSRISIKQLRHRPFAHTMSISTQIRDLSCLVAARVFANMNPRRKQGPFTKSEVLTAVLSKPQGFWNVMPCQLVRLRSNFLQIDGNHLPIGVMSRSRNSEGLQTVS